LIIPKQFQILNTVVSVEFDPMFASLTNCLGQARYHENRIILQTPSQEYTEGVIYQTFLHEMIHFILDKIGESELRANEKFVDLFASALDQVEQSSIYEVEDL